MRDICLMPEQSVRLSEKCACVSHIPVWTLIVDNKGLYGHALHYGVVYTLLKGIIILLRDVPGIARDIFEHIELIYA